MRRILAMCVCVLPENCDSLGVIYWMLVFDAASVFEDRFVVSFGNIEKCIRM